MDFEMDDIFEDFYEESNSNSTEVACISNGAIEVIQPSSSFSVTTEKHNYEQRPFVNPALRYIRSLTSDRSKNTISYALDRVAKTLNCSDYMNCPWEKLDHDTVTFLKDKLIKENLAPKTINTYLTATKQVCKFAWLDKAMPLDTFERIRDIKGVSGSRVSKGRSLSSDEIKCILQTCKDGSRNTNIRDAAVLVLMASCGLRREEVVTLKKSNLNLLTRDLIVLGKRNKERKLRVPQSAFPIIKKWIDTKENFPWRRSEPEFLFTRVHKSGKLLIGGLSGQAIADIITKRFKLADVEKFAPHDLRRTFATTMLNNGVDMPDLQIMMGHSDLSTTQIYDKRGDDRILDVMDKHGFFG